MNSTTILINVFSIICIIVALIKDRAKAKQSLMIASGAVGVIFSVLIPPVSIIGAIFFMILLWFAYRMLILKVSAIPAQWRRNLGAYAGKFKP